MGASITTQIQRSTTLAPNFSRRATFGGDVVRLDVYVDATLVVHALDLHDGLAG